MNSKIMSIGKTIKELRKNKNIRQTDLAFRCGLSVNALCQIELDNTFPHKKTIDKISKALEINPYHLMLSSINEKDIPKEKREVFKVLLNLLLNK